MGSSPTRLPMSTIEEMIDNAAETDNSTRKVNVREKDLLSFGSTLLNLAVADTPVGGLLKGYYYYIWGDSDTLKTLLGITCFAEATINDKFSNYRLIFDNAEKGSHINTDAMFNEDVGDRIEPPSRDSAGLPRSSVTVEDFYFNLDDAIKRARKGEPFIYLLDSQAAIDSDSARKKFDNNKKIYRKQQDQDSDEPAEDDDEQMKGSFGDGKAKIHSGNIRKIMSDLYDTGSILIILDQSRDKINSRFPGRTRSGGHALEFYATVQIVTSLVNKIKKNVNGIDRKIGSKVRCEVIRTRLTGKQRSVDVDVYSSTGIDDLGSCVDYLVKEKWWTSTKGIIDATEFKIKGGRDKVIRLIEKRGLEDKLAGVVAKCWGEVEEQLTVHRKNRYAK